MDEMLRLTIEAACRRLVLQAAAHTDANRPAELAALFTADAVLIRPNAAPLHGPDAIRDAYASRPADRISRHLVTGTRVDVQSADEAHATSLVLVWFGSTDDAPGPKGRPVRGEQAVGEFDDHFVRTTDGWRIARREARFVLHT
jgi:hypothetical protein